MDGRGGGEKRLKKERKKDRIWDKGPRVEVYVRISN